MSWEDHVHARDCASVQVDDLVRGPCDCLADEWCADPECSVCCDDDDEETA